MKRHETGFLNHEPGEEEQQQVALEACEVALFGGLRQQLEAGAFTGTQLAKIRDEELYRGAKCKSFESYYRRFLELNADQVRRYLQIHEVVDTLRAAGLELPASETQAVMLGKIPRERLLDCWGTLLALCAKKQVALSDRMVRGMVEIARGQQDSSSESDAQNGAGKSPGGVKVTLDFEA